MASNRRNRSWKALYREIERLRRQYDTTPALTRKLNDFPDLRIEPRARVAPTSNLITETKLWRKH